MGTGMTQEDKNLLFKDLCARLPYGVICEDEYGNALEVNSIAKPNTITFKCSDNTFWTTDLDKCKPYLFPLSSMTEEQKQYLKNRFCYDWDGEPCDFCKCQIEIGDVDELIDWFNRHHFDYRGLIEKGLAIDATGLNIY